MEEFNDTMGVKSKSDHTDKEGTVRGREEAVVSEYWQRKYRQEAAKSWNLFYKRNETRFFKDRHWIEREFAELFTPQVKIMLEVGCGVGNLVLPLMEANSNLMIYACDFSPRAIDLLRSDPRYASGKCHAFVADITKDSLNAHIPLPVDVATCVFVLSALPPEQFVAAVRNLRSILRLGGLVLFRDYSTDDAAQRRFKQDRRMSDSLFVRQDGTFAYYFQKGMPSLSDWIIWH